ncbi:hypothetical protein PGT21_003773 [Puccinia graminis f. sp. tritici]|uniref:Uncharacterized protein n=1 Tax=Puccinia graminis f. sp. tritici TaxID=56615 RepID=A0A5B0N761_PUCGR|nr:hypothetical protein PGT21_003773 [Puccinia graminis f. sp. tritici]
MSIREGTPNEIESQNILVPDDTTPTRGTPALPAIRQSARKKNPTVTPGFIMTESDSRRALRLTLPSSDIRRTQRSVGSNLNTLGSNSSNIPRSSSAVSDSQTDPSVRPDICVEPANLYNITQDSDEENNRVAARSLKSKADKKIAPRKDGTDSVLVYFSQIDQSLSFSCVWCKKIVKASASSYYNLKIHRDGVDCKGTIRSACPNRSRAIASGCKLPPTAAEKAEENSGSEMKSSSQMSAYVTKGRFDNHTLNKVMVFWLIRQSLPWARFEDHILRVGLDYVDPRTKLHSRTWAANTAKSLYLELQRVVLSDIKVSLHVHEL